MTQGGKVKVSSGNSCGNTTAKTLTITLNNCRLGEDLLNINGLTVYPNPASDHLVLEFKTPVSETFQVMVTDALGKLVLLQNFNENDGQSQFSLDVNALPAGLYWLTVKSELMLINTKVAVQ
jgi:hypothetical protein